MSIVQTAGVGPGVVAQNKGDAEAAVSLQLHVVGSVHQIWVIGAGSARQMPACLLCGLRPFLGKQEMKLVLW